MTCDCFRTLLGMSLIDCSMFCKLLHSLWTLWKELCNFPSVANAHIEPVISLLWIQLQMPSTGQMYWLITRIIYEYDVCVAVHEWFS